jgi:hypothetical protein
MSKTMGIVCERARHRRPWTPHREVSVGAVREAAARGLRLGEIADYFNVERICMAEFCARHRIEVSVGGVA